MKNQIKKFLTLLSLVIILIFVIFVINQTATIVDLAENINSQFGKIVLYSLLVIYLIIVLVPLFILFRMPRKLIAPKIKNSPEYSKFEKKLAKRLSINKYVIDSGLNGDKLIIEDAINILDKKADDEIIQIAETVFVSTAISQSGRLDGIMVLLAQTRLVWRVAKIYNQRMLPVEIVRLYANVATTTFVVTAIEEEDIMERLGQIISGAIPSAIADFVPGLKSAADIISKSMLDGGANAYLTLRIGLICKSFLSYSDLDKSVIRKSASVGALSLLSDIVKRKGIGTAKLVKNGLKHVGTRLLNVTKGTGEYIYHKGEDILEATGKMASGRTNKTVKEENSPKGLKRFFSRKRINR